MNDELNILDLFSKKYNDLFNEPAEEEFNETEGFSQGAGILFKHPESNSVLLLLRNEGGDDANVWCAPGGKVETGESTIDAAVREILEETNIQPTQYNMVTEPSYIDRRKDNFEFYNYVVDVNTHLIPRIDNEHKDWRWFPINKLPSNLHEGMIALFRELELI